MKWKKKTDILALMVGHGTQLNGVWDSGCAYGKYTEAGLMLPIVKVAVKMLRKSGVRVISDCDNGNNRNMKSSVAWANSRGAKLYMSVHCDYKFATAGVAPLYVSKTGKEFATTVGKYVAKAMKMKWKGAFKRTNLYELNATKMPSVIFETGAIKADLKYLKDYKKYGKALAKGICKYLGVKYVGTTKAEKLCKILKALDTDMNNKHFKYKMEYKKCGMSYAEACKTKNSNCATYVSFGLQKQGILEAGQIFWISNKDVVCKGDGCKANMVKNFKELHPNKPPKKADLKKGDICGYDPYHTQVFAGWKNGKPTWYSWGPKDVGKKEPLVKKTYNTRKIATILRFK